MTAVRDGASAEEARRIPSVPNLRDVGGHPTRDGGRVRSGLLYRSAALDRLDPDDAAFASLGLRAVYDLRTAGERSARPDLLPDGVAYVVADVLAGSAQPSPSELVGVLADPVLGQQAFGGDRGVAFFTEAYREFVRLDSARAAYARLFTGLAVPDHRPALVHCATGKDRTGWAVAALLLWLGVPDDVVMDDFLASGPQLEATFQAFLAEVADRGGDPDLLRPIAGVHAGYLEAAIAEMRLAFGSVEGYVADGLGIDPETRRRFRTTFVEAG